MLRSLPVDLEQVVYTGADWRRQYRWLPDGITPANFAGWGARMLIGPPRGEATVILTAGDGILLGDDGIITVRLTPARTKSMSGSQYNYVFDLIDDTGFVLRFMRGRMIVVQDVYTDA